MHLKSLEYIRALLRPGVLLFITTAFSAELGAGSLPAERVEFFEKQIRPILIERCYSCHNSADTREGGLALDHRGAILLGGQSGPAIVAGRPDRSLLIRAIRHEDGQLRMPKDGPKLDDGIVDDFAEWISQGAVDPREVPPSEKEIATLTSWEAIRDRRKAWWSFQPITKPDPPTVRHVEWSKHPVDRFLQARLGQSGLRSAEPADPATLLRRMTFVLTGLPPTVDEVEGFVGDASAAAFEQLVDRLLQSDAYGERWARHWMDWFRYAESHGSESDPIIPYAWRYRDYLIRALNADVPYDQLVLENIAGDLLAEPRINDRLQVNESALGTGQFRMVQHGFQPVDALEELVRFTDNQIDVLTKAFLGLTVSCARCHDHKFDPIGQRDYYALFGVLASCRPGMITVDAPQRLQRNHRELAALKTDIRTHLADAWIASLPELAETLTNGPSADEGTPAAERWKRIVDEIKENGSRSPLHVWSELRGLDGSQRVDRWENLRDDWIAARQRQKAFENFDFPYRWRLGGDDADQWFALGNGLREMPTRAGAFTINREGPRVVEDIFAAGAFTHLLSTKHNGVLLSPRFKIDFDEIWLRVAGNDQARVRAIVENYPRANGQYRDHHPTNPVPRWIQWDMNYFRGNMAYVELATADDVPLYTYEGQPRDGKINGRSWFGICEVLCRNKDQPQPEKMGTPLFSLTDASPPRQTEELIDVYVGVLRSAINAWRRGQMTNDQANFLAYFVRYGLLPNQLEQVSDVAALVAEYRELEAQVAVPTRAPGVWEADAFDQPLFVRGNHKEPGNVVGRRFLEALGGRSFQTPLSGRLELAREIVDRQNPLTARVMVNRVWHHLFGRGIVSTPDNFGRLGELPSHPQLLDYLGTRFIEDGWSIKRLIRLIVLSKAFQMSSVSTTSQGNGELQATQSVDPDNQLLSHFPLRRLEAEAIRDSILSVSGSLDQAMFGPSTSGDSERRSVYVRVKRLELDPFLRTFGAPEPISTIGRRANTNVPAQSLALFNDPFVVQHAERWAGRVLNNASLTSDEQRIRHMFLTALSREPTALELRQSQEFLEATAENDESTARHNQSLADANGPWIGLAHSMFNLKEFIYWR